MLTDEERKARLAELQASVRERLRADLGSGGRVTALEQPVGSLSDLEKRIADEIRRYGGRAPEIED